MLLVFIFIWTLSEINTDDDDDDDDDEWKKTNKKINEKFSSRLEGDRLVLS